VGLCGNRLVEGGQRVEVNGCDVLFAGGICHESI
jgi:hypothetical protein